MKLYIFLGIIEDEKLPKLVLVLLPVGLQVTCIQTFQNRQDSQRAAEEEDLAYRLCAAYLSLGLLYLVPSPSIL